MRLYDLFIVTNASHLVDMLEPTLIHPKKIIESRFQLNLAATSYSSNGGLQREIAIGDPPYQNIKVIWIKLLVMCGTLAHPIARLALKF